MQTFDLVQPFLETGLLQFGRFENRDEVIPFQLNLEMLPAYPDVLQLIATRAREWLELRPVNRLVSTAAAVPFGVTMSLQTGIPLVYSRGSDAPAVHDLVGAYDIGHPAVLLTNVLPDGEDIIRLANGAERVGLEIHSRIAVVNLGTVKPLDSITSFAVLSLPDVVSHLIDTRQLPAGQGQAVSDWIAANQAF